MRRPGGFLICTSLDGEIVQDTFTCAHCGNVHVVPHKQRPEDVGGTCQLCWKMICPACVNLGRCDPFEEKLKREEARYHARRSYDAAAT